MKNNNQNSGNRSQNQGYQNDENRRNTGNDNRSRYSDNDRNYQQRNYNNDEWNSGRGSSGPDAQNWQSDYGRNRYNESTQRDRGYRSSGRGMNQGSNYNDWDMDYGHERNYGADRNQFGSAGTDYNSDDWNQNNYNNGRNSYGNEGSGGGWMSQDKGTYRNSGYSEAGSRNSGNENHGYMNSMNSGNRDWNMRSGDNDNNYGSGSHRGKGPKGYKRSDERIEEDINDRLSDDANIDATNIEIKVQNGEVTLSGTVDSKMAKRRVEDMVEQISGVSDVENRLKVSKENSSSSAEGSSVGNKKSNGHTSAEKHKEKSHLN